MRSLMAEHWRSPLSAQAPSHAAHATSKVRLAVLFSQAPITRTCAAIVATQVVIFSRTGADVSKLGVGGDETAFMALVRAAAAVAEAPVPARAAACVLQLRGMGSSREVEERVRAFVSAPAPPQAGEGAALPHQRVLLLLGDMSVVTAPQLNFARQQVDAALEPVPREARPLVLALVHCPPEQLQLGFPYHAVPASDWGFAFCDALGLSDAIPELAAPSAVAAPPAAGAAAASARLATDPRRWVAVGYGLLDRPTPAEARVEFEAEFVKALRAAVTGVKMNQSTMTSRHIRARGIEAAEALYVGGPFNAEKRADAAMAIFQSRPYLRDVLLDCFVHTWGETLQVRTGLPLSLPSEFVLHPPPPAALQRTVRGAALALLSGQAVKGGMLEMVRGSLRWLLEDFLRTTYLALAQVRPRSRFAHV